MASRLVRRLVKGRLARAWRSIIEHARRSHDLGTGVLRLGKVIARGRSLKMASAYSSWAGFCRYSQAREHKAVWMLRSRRLREAFRILRAIVVRPRTVAAVKATISHHEDDHHAPPQIPPRTQFQSQRTST